MDDNKIFVEDEVIDTASEDNSDIKQTRSKKKSKIRSGINASQEPMDKDESITDSFTGKVTYFNPATMIVGIRCDGIGYQTKANKVYSIGESVSFHVKNGEVVAE